MDPVSTDRRNEGGIPRGRGGVPPPHGVLGDESWPGANEAKVEKLRLRSLRREAGAQGLELRHSDHGYALIDTARKLVNQRNNMTLDEVESWLDLAFER